MWLASTAFVPDPLPVDAFPAEALVEVRSFHPETGTVVFQARVAGPSSATHLRIRTDDGLVFLVPAQDCRVIAQDTP